MPTAQDAYQQQLIEIASLSWSLVVLSRRSWTALSLAVVAGWGWALVAISRTSHGFLGWSLGLVAVFAAFTWLVTRQRISTVQQLLGERFNASRARFTAGQRPLANRPELAVG